MALEDPSAAASPLVPAARGGSRATLGSEGEELREAREAGRAVDLPRLAAMLYGARGSCDSLVAKRVRSMSRCAGKHESARTNLARASLMMRRIGIDDARELFRRHADVVAWVDGGLLPGGREDPEYSFRSTATRKNQYSTLVMLATRGKCAEELARQVDSADAAVFARRLAELSDTVREESERSQLSARESGAILPWPEIERAYESRRPEIGADSEVGLLLDWLLADPRGFPPKRLDFGAVLLVRTRDRGDAAAARAPVSRDFLAIHPSLPTSELHLRSYKTHVHYGEFVQTVPPAVTAAVVRFMSARGWRRWLFCTSDGRTLSPGALGHRISSAMRQLTGVPIGASNLRKSFVTSALTDPRISAGELRTLAEKMMHSTAVQARYRRIGLGVGHDDAADDDAEAAIRPGSGRDRDSVGGSGYMLGYTAASTPRPGQGATGTAGAGAAGPGRAPTP
jgi:hypothetical protein